MFMLNHSNPVPQDAVTEIATKWSKVLKTGAVDVNFMGIDLNTIMFTLMRGQDTIEVRLLSSPDKCY